MYNIWKSYKKNSKELFSIIGKYSEGNKINKIIRDTFEKTGKITDKDLYTIIRSKVKVKDVFGVKGEIIRGKKRASEVLSVISQLKRKKIIRRMLKKYLDIGTGRGFITMAIGQKMKLNTYGIDVVDERHRSVKKRQMKGRFKVYDGKKIPWSGFDIITLMMVIHHVEDLTSFLNSLYESLADDGIVIVREHNAYNADIKRLIHIQHEIFDAIYSKDAIYTFSGYENYMSRARLIKEMKKANFTHINVKVDFKYNPTKYYYIVFRKNVQGKGRSME